VILSVTINDAVRIWMQGAIAMGYLIVACFFLRFWKETHERLFIFFTTGFAVLALHRTLFALCYDMHQWDELTFALRLAGYSIILGGIIERRLRRSTIHT
jgi:Family of unknown function (DUF5985)